MNKNNQNKYNQLRKTYSNFVFEQYSIIDNQNEIAVKYHFSVDDKHDFHPSFSIPKNAIQFAPLTANALENLVFQIGLVELISYWKAICPQNVIIKAGYLNAEQVMFWKKLYFNGLGEFFHIQGIDADIDDFMHLHAESDRFFEPFEIETEHSRVLIPVGGGKDSAVTLELLGTKQDVKPFIINPRKASLQTALAAGYAEQDVFIVHRSIDSHLLALNAQGYLNGHTPFSALVAFLSVLAAMLTKSRYIALSNESSANEPTVQNGANHQYSKSFEFESDFRQYMQKYLTRSVEYFSFLRPLNEYTIARLFAKMDKYHTVFRSCNVGSKNDVWCGKCSKCLFTFIMLSPFLDNHAITRMFEKNLFDDITLISYLDELTGHASQKPFECVGTVDEVNFALNQTLQKYPGKLPALLQYYQEKTGKAATLNSRVAGEFDHHHFLPE